MSERERGALERALTGALQGEVRFDAANRAAYATDSSNYRHVPLGVVFPRHANDVRAAAQLAAEAGAPLLARGAGTSLAGQCCNEAVVVDMSRHMRKIWPIDADARTVRVQPGVVLDDLRREAEKYGLTFGPDPATHAWCTLGGMIGNNSCGTHGLYAGKTSDNVEGLSLVLADGEQLDVGGAARDWEEISAAGGRLGQISRDLWSLHQKYGGLVAARFPGIPRRVSGYNLDELTGDAGPNLARALVGTESTCAFTTEAILRLVPSPPARCLVLLSYPDIYLAAASVPELLHHSLLALEGFDRELVEQTKAHHLNEAGVALLPPGGGWLLAETGGADIDEARSRAEEVVQAVRGLATGRVVHDHQEQRLIWAVRESGLGATAIRLDGGHNYEGWEDGAVPPDRLAEYLRGITKLWGEHGYSGAWYGHFGQGCVHTRNNFDFHSREGLASYRRYVTAAAELVVSLGGSLSGEHGDGQSRGELLEMMFGSELVKAFGEFKRAWDPGGLMNPGKVVDPAPLDSNIRYYGLKDRRELRPRGFALTEDAGSLLNASLRCVGVGRCRRDDAATMCPSYRATRDEVHSTRGRAKLLTEMFQGSPVEPSWRSPEVREALDLCLSCKACASDCPTHVDMATYKAEFMSHYYRGRRRPAAMYAMGLVPWAARLATNSRNTARLANWAAASRAGNILKQGVGLAENRPIPRFAGEGGLRRLAREGPGERADRPASASTVVMWPDTFTESFRPQAGTDLVVALEALGERVAVPMSWACCARPLYDFGMLDLAKRSLRRLVSVLWPWTSAGVPVIVPEPSCLAAFRDELPSLLPDHPGAQELARAARSPAEHLVATGHLEHLEAGPFAGRAVLHPHCHQRSVVGTAAEREVLAKLGFETEVLDAGCCGLAGSFGFSKRHEPVSRKIGEELWLPRVRAALSVREPDLAGPGRGPHFVVDGFSCREQLRHLAPGVGATDLPALLRGATTGPGPSRA